MTITEADFEQLSWHDCHIWGIELRAGNPEEDDWTSQLALDIDFIVEWLCGVDGVTRFRVAPASLVFDGVTDPRIHIDWGRSGFQAAVHPISIASIERAPIADQKVYLDRPYHRWTIHLNWPDSSEISFGAVGFTQTFHAEPILTEHQHLSFKERSRLVKPQSNSSDPEGTTT